MDLLVVGLGVTGEALARHAARRGWRFTVVEDAPEGEPFEARRAAVEALGGVVVERADPIALRRLVDGADLVVPSPGVPAQHPVFGQAHAAGTAIVSEVELAARSARVPLIAVTGTNGKTTVTSLVAEMLTASGVRTLAAGNIGRPLVEAVEEDADALVVEVSSFQLCYTETFHPTVAAMLNLADDHLDWHPSPEHYRESKERIFANQSSDDALVLNAADPVVADMARRAPSRVVWFSDGLPGDAFSAGGSAYRVEGDHLVGPDGAPFVRVDELARRHRHDLANALAATAITAEAGGSLAAAADVLHRFTGLPHRLTLVGEAGGVAYYDDSKATNPHAALAAVRDFESVVLLAGGRNKGLSLRPLAEGADRVRAVVAFGEAAGEVAEVFAGLCPVERVTGMREAVEAARRLAEPGDAVLLSPGCASFDAYPGYAARGDHFAAEVERTVGAGGG